jgi:hypothetical protein
MLDGRFGFFADPHINADEFRLWHRHVLEFGHFAPPALSRGKPSLPCGRLTVDWRPIGVDQNMLREIDGSLQLFR